MITTENRYTGPMTLKGWTMDDTRDCAQILRNDTDCCGDLTTTQCANDYAFDYGLLPPSSAVIEQIFIEWRTIDESDAEAFEAFKVANA